MILGIFITIVLVLLNAFFVAAEFAIVKVRHSQVELKVKSGKRSALLAQNIVNHLDRYLAATQLGITLASLGLGWIGEPVVSKMIIAFMNLFGVNISPELAHGIALPLAFIIITILHIVFGELAPKSIAIQRAAGTTFFIAAPLQFFYFIFKPFIWVLNGFANLFIKAIGITPIKETDAHTSEELKYLVRQGQKSGRIDKHEYKIIKNAFDFSEQVARQIMLPRTQIFAVDLNDYSGSTIEKILDEGFSRIPCYEDNLDNLVGVVYLKDILLLLRKNKNVDLRSITRPIIVIPETKHIGHLLNEFQVKHQQMAAVVNEYGGTEGIITMEDILEELVGEIQDEYDNELPVLQKTGNKTYTAISLTSLDDLNELLPHPIEKEGDYETLAGCLISRFGKIPSTRDKIICNDYEISILKRNRSTIVLVQLIDLRK